MWFSGATVPAKLTRGGYFPPLFFMVESAVHKKLIKIS